MKRDGSALTTGANAARLRIAPPSGRRADKILVLSIEATASGAVVLHCQGQVLCRSEARALSSMIMEVLPPAERMVVDLAGVQFLDSSALGELVLTHMWAEAAGYKLTFSTPTDSVQRLFESTNLVSVFDAYPTVEDALEGMQLEEVGNC